MMTVCTAFPRNFRMKPAGASTGEIQSEPKESNFYPRMDVKRPTPA